MRLSDYNPVTELAPTDKLITDTANGTKNIQASDLAKALMALMTPEEFASNIDMSALEAATGLKADDLLMIGTEAKNKKLRIDEVLYDIIDATSNVSINIRKSTWRGKNLGSVVTQAQWDAVKDGSFKGLFLGDYWEIGGRVWRIVDFNYWIHMGDNSCETYHAVVLPDRSLYTHNMNDTNVTTGGYHGSKMYTEGLNQAKTIINGAFGEAHILKHRELLTNAVDSTAGYPTAGAWYDSTVELMNEPMIYGSYIFAPGSTGSATPCRYTIDKTQLAGFRLMCDYLLRYREWFWLRDVVSSSWFAHVGNNGNATYEYASRVGGVRPIFGIKK